MANYINAVAGGDISTSRFVKIDTSADNQVVACGAGELPIGISSEAAYDAPIPGASTLAASSGYSCRVYSVGTVVNLQADSSGWTRGAKIKSGAAGVGVATTTADDIFGAIALESAPANGIARVLMIIGNLPV